MKHIKAFLMIAVCALVLSACGTTSTVPITGRKHSLLVDDQTILSLSTQQYNEVLSKSTLSKDANKTAMVKRVGQKLANAVETFLRNNGMAAEVNNFAWEFNLVQDNQVNAFCMPGGKIVVYEGLLPVTQNEPSLAIVLGHEIAHAVAKHSAEQMSKQIRQQYGTQILGGILGSAVGSGIGNAAQAIASARFSFANLKYSRDNETEADHMGLIFAAMAGYDPREAIPFWQRMSQGSTNQDDLFSDHPSDEKRIAHLQKVMPEALQYYRPANTTTTQPATTTKKASGKTYKFTTKKSTK